MKPFATIRNEPLSFIAFLFVTAAIVVHFWVSESHLNRFTPDTVVAISDWQNATINDLEGVPQTKKDDLLTQTEILRNVALRAELARSETNRSALASIICMFIALLLLDRNGRIKKNKPEESEQGKVDE